MDVRLAEPITAALREAEESSDTGYPGDGPAYAEAFAAFADARWGWHGDPQLCIGYPDLNASGVAVVAHFARAEGRVVITPPVYNAFYVWRNDAGLQPVEVPLGVNTGIPDLDGIAAALADGVRVVLISNPHNPLGRLWRREESARLADLAAQHDAVVISDEIHAPLTFPGQEFVPYLTVSENASTRGLARIRRARPGTSPASRPRSWCGRSRARNSLLPRNCPRAWDSSASSPARRPSATGSSGWTRSPSGSPSAPHMCATG